MVEGGGANGAQQSSDGCGAALANSQQQTPRWRGGSMGGAVPVFPGGPLQQATDLLDQIKEARAAASASVAEFRQAVELQQDCSSEADSLASPRCSKERLSDCSSSLHESREAASRDGGVEEAVQDEAATRLQQQLQAAEARAARAQQQLSQAQQELAQMQADRADIQTEMSSMQTSLAALAEQLKVAEHWHATAEQQLQHNMPAQLQSVTLQLQHAHEHAEQKEATLQQAQAQLTLAVQQLQQTSADAALLRGRVDKAEAEAAESGQLLHTAAVGIAAAHSQLQQLVSVKQQLQAVVGEACTNGEASCSQLHDAILLLQEKETGAKAAAHALQQQQKQQLAAARASAAAQASLVEQLQHKLSGLEQQLREAESAAAVTASELQQQLEAAHSAAAERKQQLATVKAELLTQQRLAKEDSHEQQLVLLQAELEAGKARLADAEQQVQELQATANTRLDMLDTLQAQLTETRQQLDAAKVSAATTAADTEAGAEVRAAQQQQQEPTGLEDFDLSSIDSVVPLADAIIRALSGGGGDGNGFGSSSNGAATASTAVAAAESSTVGRPLSWLDAAEAIRLADEVPAAASSLLDELRCESDELSQQLSQLQNYLKRTSSSLHGGDNLTSIQAMDEGLQALKQLTGETLEVAASTVERVHCSSAVRSAPVSMGGRAPSGAGAPLSKQHASCDGAVERSRGVVSAGGGGRQASGGGGVRAGSSSRGTAAAAGGGGRTVAMRRLGLDLTRLESWGSGATGEVPGQQHTEATSLPPPAAATAAAEHDSLGLTASGSSSSAAPLASLPTLTSTLDHWGSQLSEGACNWLAGDLHVDEDLTASFSSGPGAAVETEAETAGVEATAVAAHGGSAAAFSVARLPLSRLAAASMSAADEAGLLAAWGSGVVPGASGAGVGLGLHQLLHQQPSGMAAAANRGNSEGSSSPAGL